MTAGWQRLDRRTVWASTVLIGGSMLAVGVPVSVGLVLSGLSPGWTAFWVVGGVLLTAVATAVGETIRLAVTRFRVDAHRIERRTQFLGSSHTALATERIRNVEVAADLVQRRFGVAELRLATGDKGESRFKLVTLDREYAEQLRAQLQGERASGSARTLATMDWGWLRFAPVSLWTPLLGVFAFGGLFQVADRFQAVPAMLDWFTGVVRDLPWPLVGVGLLVTGVVVGTVAIVAIQAEAWWDYRLEQRDDGSLELGRGLVVNRTTSFDGRRLRGVTLHEPPGLRRFRAASLDVIAVGVRGSSAESERERQSPALVPAAPRTVTVRVAESVTGLAWPQSLRAHPPAARHKRFVRAAVGTGAVTLLAVVPALLWSWLWWVPVGTVLVATPVALWLAADNSRGLGHQLGTEHVTIRRGSLLRRTEVLHRRGLLGWNLRQTPFQRRAGLVTLVATSAGGNGAFRLPDVGGGQAPEVYATAGTVWEHLMVPPRGVPGD